MTMRKTNNLSVGTVIEFYPILGAHHIAEGRIVASRTSGGVRFYEVVGRLLANGAPETTWTICPEDVRFVRPLAGLNK